jgi:hypothetical protein
LGSGERSWLLFERLGDPGGGAGGLGVSPQALVGFGREKYDRHAAIGRELAQRPDEFEPIHDRHVEIGDDQMHRIGPGRRQPRRAVAGLDDAIADAAQRDLHHLSHARRIVDRQHRFHDRLPALSEKMSASATAPGGGAKPALFSATARPLAGGA